MKIIRDQLKKVEPLFEKGKPLEKFYPLYEAIDSFLFTPGNTTVKAPFVRDAIDIKRVMIFVVIALLPCFCMGVYNVGYEALKFSGQPIVFAKAVGIGLRHVLPILIVTYAVGGFWEALFAIIRKHEINEGFLVTGFLYAMVLPPTIPLWEAAVGISFGVVIGKEIFGGTGFNILNPALASRAFVFFAYPAQMSGDKVWLAADGVTQATPLSAIATSARGQSAVQVLHDAGYSFHQMFLGFIPGSIGETSTLACLLGLAFLLITGVASWRVVVGCVLGLLSIGSVFFFFHGQDSLTFLTLPPQWHLVMGGFAFGAVFMATDPVSSSATDAGRWIYGFLIGGLVVLIRMVNPAYPEGVMLAILLMNIFAPLIDHFVVEIKLKRRAAVVAAIKSSV